MLLRILFLVFICSFSLHGSEKIYKWIDKEGKVHYGDKLPKNQKESKALLIDSSSKKQEQTTPPMTAAERVAKANQWLKASQEQRDYEKKLKAKTALEKETKAKECDRWTKRLNKYKSSDSLVFRDKNGEVVILSESSQQKAIQETQQQVNYYCNL